jgi:hypothetical protein
MVKLTRHTQDANEALATGALLTDLCQIIEQGRSHASRMVNSALAMTFWRVGDRIRRELLHDERAPYGKKIVATASQQLIAAYGSGYTVSGLSRMMELLDLMDLKSANIRVAQYLHALPELQVLQSQLHRAVQLARERQAADHLPNHKDAA